VKKLIVLVVAMFIMVGGLVGCGDSKPKTNPPAGTTSS
jgi:hypothetical protein